MCLICERIKMIQEGTNPYFVKELETGYVVIGDHQCFKGYTLFLCKRHVTELHHLEPDFKNQYLAEMALVEEAVARAFHADKMNCELLGNGDSHLHWHLFPRVSGDMPCKGPVWMLSFDELYAKENMPKEKERNEMKNKLRKELEVILKREVVKEHSGRLF